MLAILQCAKLMILGCSLEIDNNTIPLNIPTSNKTTINFIENGIVTQRS